MKCQTGFPHALPILDTILLADAQRSTRGEAIEPVSACQELRVSLIRRQASCRTGPTMPGWSVMDVVVEKDDLMKTRSINVLFGNPHS